MDNTNIENENFILKELPKKAKYSMLISDILMAIFILTVLKTIFFVIKNIDFIPLIVNTILTWVYRLVLIQQILDIVLTQIIGYKRIKYMISDKSVEISKGLFFVKHEIVPIRKIQQIDTVQGPINKIFDLANLSVITAGGDIELEYINIDEVNEIAMMLRNKVNEFAKESNKKETVEKSEGQKDEAESHI